MNSFTLTREVTPNGLGAKVGLDMNNGERRRRGLLEPRLEIHMLRERWAVVTNDALREAKVDARVDHRSLAARGIDREPMPQFPRATLRMERRGVRSFVAERIREDYRRRVAARLERNARAATESAAHADGEGAAGQLKDVEEIRRQAREAWRALRTGNADALVVQQAAVREFDGASRDGDAAAPTRDRDDDLAL